MDEKKKKKIKQGTAVIIVSVLLLTLVTLRTSYSVFFEVKSKSTVQQITTGTLSVSIDNDRSSAMSAEYLLPTSNSDLPKNSNSVVSGNYAKLSLTNSGDLDADFTVALSYDTLPEGKTQNDLIEMRYLNIGVFDKNENEWVNFGDDASPIYYTNVTGLTPGSDGSYPFLRDIISAAENQNNKLYHVYIWLDEDTPTTEIGKIAYLKLVVKSATVNGKIES